MIYLSYKLSHEFNEKAPIINWATADSMTLRYEVFLGDQIFLVDDADFSALWGWVPILDFAASMVSVAEELASGETDVQFEFTDSGAVINFSRLDQRLMISSSYTTARARVGLDELHKAAQSYARTVFEDATALYPALKNNRSFLARYPVKT
jgi:hypothetical protein